MVSLDFHQRSFRKIWSRKTHVIYWHCWFGNWFWSWGKWRLILPEIWLLGDLGNCRNEIGRKACWRSASITRDQIAFTDSASGAGCKLETVIDWFTHPDLSIPCSNIEYHYSRVCFTVIKTLLHARCDIDGLSSSVAWHPFTTPEFPRSWARNTCLWSIWTEARTCCIRQSEFMFMLDQCTHRYRSTSRYSHGELVVPEPGGLMVAELEELVVEGSVELPRWNRHVCLLEFHLHH